MDCIFLSLDGLNIFQTYEKLEKKNVNARVEKLKKLNSLQNYCNRKSCLFNFLNFVPQNYCNRESRLFNFLNFVPFLSGFSWIVGS